jgi:hypothetical protein
MKVIIVFERKKGLPSIVQAGLFLTAGALVSACGEQPAPVDSGPARVAAASTAATSNNADIPEIVVTASRSSESET